MARYGPKTTTAAAVGAMLLAMSGCDRDAPGTKGAASQATANPTWDYLCKSADTPPPAADCTARRKPDTPPDIAVIYTCPKRADPRPPGCQEVGQPPVVGAR